MFIKADNRQEDTIAVQREARQIRIELERQRIEAEKQRKQVYILNYNFKF